MNGAALPSTEAGAEHSRERGSRRSFLLRAAVGVIAIAVLLRLEGAHQIAATLGRERPGWFAAAVALYLGGQVMSAYRWKLLGGLAGLRSPWIAYLRYYFIGMFTNLFVPGLAGGDAARAAYLGVREQRGTAAAASVIADRGIGLAALVWFAALAIVLSHAPLPAALVRTTYTVAAVGAAGLLAGPIAAGILQRSGYTRWNLVGAAIVYLRRPAALAPAILLSLALQASLALCQYWLGCGMGIRVPLGELFAIVPLANLAASLPITLNGLGVREGSYLVLLGAAGVPHEAAIALGLAWFVATEVGGLSGSIAFLTTGLPGWAAARTSF